MSVENLKKKGRCHGKIIRYFFPEHLKWWVNEPKRPNLPPTFKFSENEFLKAQKECVHSHKEFWLQFWVSVIFKVEFIIFKVEFLKPQRDVSVSHFNF